MSNLKKSTVIDMSIVNKSSATFSETMACAVDNALLVLQTPSCSDITPEQRKELTSILESIKHYSVFGNKKGLNYFIKNTLMKQKSNNPTIEQDSPLIETTVHLLSLCLTKKMFGTLGCYLTSQDSLYYILNLMIKNKEVQDEILDDINQCLEDINTFNNIKTLLILMSCETIRAKLIKYLTSKYATESPHIKIKEKTLIVVFKQLNKDEQAKILKNWRNHPTHSSLIEKYTLEEKVKTVDTTVNTTLKNKI